MHTIFNFCIKSKYFLCDTKTFSINATHIYVEGELFFVIMYSFSVQHERCLVNISLSLGCHTILFVPTKYFFVAHVILVCNLTSMWNIFCCWYNILFCATRNSFSTYRNSQTLNASVGHWTLDFGLWTLDCGRWTLDCGPSHFKILNCLKLWKQWRSFNHCILEFFVCENLQSFQIWKFIYSLPISGQCSLSNHVKNIKK